MLLLDLEDIKPSYTCSNPYIGIQVPRLVESHGRTHGSEFGRTQLCMVKSDALKIVENKFHGTILKILNGVSRLTIPGQ